MKQTKRILKIEVKRLVDIDPDGSYLTQEGFEDRLESYNAGDWAFMGIRAVAEVVSGNLCQTLTSGGLWGIEDDSSEEYLKEIEQEQLGELRAVLHEFGFSKRAIAAAIKGI